MKKLVSLVVSLLILGAIYWRVGFEPVLGAITNANLGFLLASLLLLAIPILLSAFRLFRLCPVPGVMSQAEALRLTLAANALNMVLPSKLGDLAKAWFMTGDGALTAGKAVSLVVYEKSCDMLALLLLGLAGLGMIVLFGMAPAEPGQVSPLIPIMALSLAGLAILLIAILLSRRLADLFFGLLQAVLPGKLRVKAAKLQGSWTEMQDSVRDRRGRMLEVFLVSLVIWLLHMTQVWLIIQAVNPDVPYLATLGLAPLAILAGLLPLTFAGIGTRDAGFILFFAAYLTQADAAAVGLLSILRYVAPALFGVPFAARYMSKAASMRRDQTTATDADSDPAAPLSPKTGQS